MSLTPLKLPKPRVSACEQMSLYMNILGGHLGFQQPSVSPGQAEPLLFYTARLWGLLFLGLDPWVGEPGVELRSFTPQRGPPPPRIPPHAQPLPVDVGQAHFASPPLLSALM